MNTFKASRYDGSRSARMAVTVTITAGGIHVSGDGLARQYPFAEVMIQPRLAGVFTQLRFADGSQCDIENQPGLDEALAHIPGQSANRLIHRLENNLLYILLAVLLSVGVLIVIIQYGVPVMAREVAYRIPPEIETDMGMETLALFDHVMQPSELDASRQSELRHKFMSLVEQDTVAPDNILFRKGEELGANAFALPAGIIVFTDEIVAMAKDDRELLAVFAHELAHVEYRHTMRHVLQNSVTGLLVILVTGDIGTASSLAAALPTILLQSKFSRDFEAEADDYAIGLLTRHAVSPAHLGAILQRLEAEAGSDDLPGFLSTHPATDERIKKLGGVRHD